MSGAAKPRLLVIGGCGGLAGRAVLEEFAADWSIRSVHRHPVPSEAQAEVEWMPGDAASVPDWTPYLEGVDVVLNLAWYRQGREHRFRSLGEGLVRLVRASERAGVRRWLQVSVPEAPPALETQLPYLVWKRFVDRAVIESSVPHSVVRPTMLFGPQDKLLTVMLRTIHRYHRFPMFADGEYHVSPIAARDLARILRHEAETPGSRVVPAGGPRRWVYRELTDRLFAALGREPRYFPLGPRGSVRLARLLETFGSDLLYAYEVEWLLSDMLGLPPYVGLDRPLEPVEPFLDAEGARLGRRDPKH